MRFLIATVAAALLSVPTFAAEPPSYKAEIEALKKRVAELERKLDTPAYKPACVCGDDCKCKGGDCPAKCPVVTSAVPQTELWLVNGQLVSVPKGQQPTQGAFQYSQPFTVTGGSCAGGSCSGGSCSGGSCGAPTQRGGFFFRR